MNNLLLLNLSQIIIAMVILIVPALDKCSHDEDRFDTLLKYMSYFVAIYKLSFCWSYDKLALIKAIEDDDYYRVKLILEGPIDVNFYGLERVVINILFYLTQNRSCLTLHLPIIVASSINSEQITKLLLERGAEVNIQHSPWSPLWFSSSKGHKETTNLLLKYDADLYHTN